MPQIDTGTTVVVRSRALAGRVDNTDWLKAAAIISVAIDHFGFFFVDEDRWWSVLGRFAAPVFFFLVGYAQSRIVPLYWIWVGILLTLLETWNVGWTWVAPNILLSLAILRAVRPYVQVLVEQQSWPGFVLLALACIAVEPLAARMLDYGAEGWLWALFGLCQRRYIESMARGLASQPPSGSAPRVTETTRLMRLAACVIAALFYIWQEQKEYSFVAIQLAAFILGLCAMAASLCVFRRGESRLRLPDIIAGTFRFVGRHTLEIYALQLAASELIVKLAPDLAP